MQSLHATRAREPAGSDKVDSDGRLEARGGGAAGADEDELSTETVLRRSHWFRRDWFRFHAGGTSAVTGSALMPPWMAG